jgi:hypothetical protein
MKEQEKLLDKYYRGETTVDEERELMNWITSNENESAEKDMFGYFKNEIIVPRDLEETLFSGIEKKQIQKNQLNTRLIRIVSAAAVILIILSIYLNIQTGKNAEMENNFYVMEQALFQVSESIQPEEQEEMLVLWVDNDVEIIIN